MAATRYAAFWAAQTIARYSSPNTGREVFPTPQSSSYRPTRWKPRLNSCNGGRPPRCPITPGPPLRRWSVPVGGRGFLFVVMEYADQTLAQILPRRALSLDEAREMLLPTLNALAFLHRNKLVQGQLKPTNLLVVDDQLKTGQRHHPFHRVSNRRHPQSLFVRSAGVEGRRDFHGRRCVGSGHNVGRSSHTASPRMVRPKIRNGLLGGWYPRTIRGHRAALPEPDAGQPPHGRRVGEAI